METNDRKTAKPNVKQMANNHRFVDWMETLAALGRAFEIVMENLALDDLLTLRTVNKFMCAEATKALNRNGVTVYLEEDLNRNGNCVKTRHIDADIPFKIAEVHFSYMCYNFPKFHNYDSITSIIFTKLPVQTHFNIEDLLLKFHNLSNLAIYFSFASRNFEFWYTNLSSKLKSIEIQTNPRVSSLYRHPSQEEYCSTCGYTFLAIGRFLRKQRALEKLFINSSLFEKISPYCGEFARSLKTLYFRLDVRGDDTSISIQSKICNFLNFFEINQPHANVCLEIEKERLCDTSIMQHANLRQIRYLEKDDKSWFKFPPRKYVSPGLRKLLGRKRRLPCL